MKTPARPSVAIAGPRAGILVALAAIALLATILIVALKSTSPGRPGGDPGGLSVSISVEPFEVGDSVPATWDSPAFAESLAARLSTVPGLQVTVTDRDSHFALRGSVAMKEGRLILATRLGRDSERDTVWTATFWRSATASSTLLSDLATAVAEAAINTRVQESLAPKREKP